MVSRTDAPFVPQNHEPLIDRLPFVAFAAVEVSRMSMFDSKPPMTMLAKVPCALRRRSMPNWGPSGSVFFPQSVTL